MKKAFTLLEMLVVVAVLVTMMAIVFRLSSVASGSEQRNITASKLQRVEFCLSGYYAAYGSYPPVALHADRNIFREVDELGHQRETGEENAGIWSDESAAWRQVSAALAAQPMECAFPFASGYKDYVKSLSEILKARAEAGMEGYEKFMNPFDDGVSENIHRHNEGINEISWERLKLFKFGLMSFLLPRYLVMMNAGGGDEGARLYEYAQWTSNNQEISDPYTGSQYGWTQIREDAIGGRSGGRSKISAIPSQAVCARWIHNLEKSCKTTTRMKLYGIEIKDDRNVTAAESTSPNLELYRPCGSSEGDTQGLYILDYVTVVDGWHRPLYYYSPAPYQTYTLWSAGANGKTFPPWVSREKLGATANEMISRWLRDDILRLSH
jgi:prepilin-type N-terminal cleavage/methylation domain-containing protein